MDYTVAIGAIATSMNVIIIYYKFTHHKMLSGIIDIGVLVVLSYLFMGTMAGLSIGMIASFVFSIFLLISPPKENKDLDQFDDLFKSM